jgi:hypothetical protein
LGRARVRAQFLGNPRAIPRNGGREGSCPLSFIDAATVGTLDYRIASHYQ